MVKSTNNDNSQLSEQESQLAQEAIVLLDKYRKLQDRYTALLNLNQLSNDCADLNTFYRQVHQAIASIMNANNFYIVMYDQTFATLEFVYHVDEKDDFPKGTFDYDKFQGSMTCHVIETGEPLLMTPEKMQQQIKEGTLKAIGTTGTDWLGVPLISDGFVIGVMAVQSYTETTRYQEHDLDLLTFTAQHTVSAMTRLQDRERLQKAVDARTRELMKQIREREKSELLQESLFRISELTNQASLDLDKFYPMVHNIVGQLINAENFYIAKHNSAEDLLSFVYFSEQNSEEIERKFATRKFANGYTELVISTAKTVLLSGEDMFNLYKQGKTVKPSGKTKSWLGVPLLQNGEAIGAMVIQSYHLSTIYTEQDAELLNFVSQHVATAIKRRELAIFERKTHELLEQQVKHRTAELEEEIKQREKMEQQLKYAASHDSLTGLPNRTVFLDLLNHAIACHRRRPEMQFAVLFLDLDRFKVVNDSLGHHAGDILLKEMAKGLTDIVRDKDTVARLGGDEFVILIEDLVNKQEAYDVAQRITELLTKPFFIENQPVFIGTSIGVLFNDIHYESAEFMLRDADTAMYHAKDMGKGRYEVFDASMHKKVQNALTLEADLREGISKKEFSPYFQPIVRLNDKQIVGFEALARWRSEKRGLVFPNDFIPLAEETNLVLAIDFQIIEKSCRQLKSWQEALKRDDLYISCNLYCDHFFDTNLANDIAQILQRVGLEPRHLRVELTERALLEKTEIVLTNMKALKKLGVKILLDDFGTGYSSLSYLHRFPIDVLKIDRSFISNVHEHDNNRAIIKTIIDLAVNLQMATIGEGIENAADAQLLVKMECKYGQGYYFNKPMPAHEVERLLS
ncbi:bifunctional diguanylate cyclase/phosphodiesterase [Thalassotalea insulae]|uniref:Bifunctional diguanylate cyclase/phosphodiesterase n=1 Tax=Thalassotalea insulae TaxID=2056778 RepID=A0ABQ6GUW0_9GAMM|nr:EAL domain-containing protein [Thalassotalea insulae]GLX79144.1 bifunctional diguanylate cyclase/phosphodiesterase [Thalassotalea insulae]